MIAFQITEFLASFIEALLGISINAKMLDGEEFKVKDNIIASFIIAITIWFINQFWIFSALATVAGIAGIVISSRIIYKIKIFDSIAFTAVYLLLVYTIDFLSMTFIGVMVKDTQFANVVVSELSYVRVCFLMLAKVFLCLVYVILEKSCLTKIQIPARKLCTGVILAWVQVAVLVKNTFAHIDSDTFFIWLLLFLLVLTIVYLVIQIMSYIENNDRMRMAMDRNILLADNYEKAIKQYRNEQIFYHDVKNQFLILKNYLKNGEFNKAEDYVEQLGFVELQTLKHRTGIDALDILLEYKKKEAQERHIHMDIIADSVELKLSECEIVALFGNLLDNAIEACSKIENDIKWIRVAIRRMQEMTFIKISNSYGEHPVFTGDKFVSTKKKKEMHGLGMTSMKIIVEKYEGSIDVSCDCGKFTVMISFFN